MVQLGGYNFDQQQRGKFGMGLPSRWVGIGSCHQRSAYRCTETHLHKRTLGPEKHDCYNGNTEQTVNEPVT